MQENEPNDKDQAISELMHLALAGKYRQEHENHLLPKYLDPEIQMHVLALMSRAGLLEMYYD